jgi:hypothetical protein
MSAVRGAAVRARVADRDEGARIEERVAREEVPHVRFALRWFVRLSPRVRAGEPLFDAWRASLPPPLTPILMRGSPIARELRTLAGQGGPFVEALESFRP